MLDQSGRDFVQKQYLTTAQEGPYLRVLMSLKSNSQIALAAIIGGVCVSSIVLVGIFSQGDLSTVPWIVGSLCLMGIALGYFISPKRG